MKGPDINVSAGAGGDVKLPDSDVDGKIKGPDANVDVKAPDADVDVNLPKGDVKGGIGFGFGSKARKGGSAGAYEGWIVQAMGRAERKVKAKKRLREAWLIQVRSPHYV